MKYLFFLLGYLFYQDVNIPFKSSEEFLLKVDLKFKEKPPEFKTNSYSATGDRLDKLGSTQQPFVTFDLAILRNLPDEKRIKVVDSNGKSLVKKKLPLTGSLYFDMGFVDDLKGHISANEIIVFFESEKKVRLRRIAVTIDEDGTLRVNGAWHGKF